MDITNIATILTTTINMFFKIVSDKVLEKSLHLGCPVVHGEKWVFNKWVVQ